MNHKCFDGRHIARFGDAACECGAVGFYQADHAIAAPVSKAESLAHELHRRFFPHAQTAPIDGDKVYEDARAFCYGVAGHALKPFTDFSQRERQIIDAIAEWMGSRDCVIAQLKIGTEDQSLSEASGSVPSEAQE